MWCAADDLANRLTGNRGWRPERRHPWLNAPSGKKDSRLPVHAAGHNVLLTVWRVLIEGATQEAVAIVDHRDTYGYLQARKHGH